MSEKPKRDRLPGPPQLILAKLSKPETAELIEKYICFVDEDGRKVRLQDDAVRQFMRRDDRLPPRHSISQLPILRADGTMLGDTGTWLHRETGIQFVIPEELTAYLPRENEKISGENVAQAMSFLCDEWLVDVACDYAGKCVLVACVLTVIERVALPARPAFFVTSGRRGTGKTTAIHMVSLAVTGKPASAAAWSSSEEERRKMLLACFDAGIPLLVWDNIARGGLISSPHLEKALTSEFYEDRVLGVTKWRTAPAYMACIFTGNNIAPRGDMASRSLVARFKTDRPDPENREFDRGDPQGWTLAHRGEILEAMYTILLGNPQRSRIDIVAKGEMETRFKEWLHLVGTAVENAALEHARSAGMLDCLPGCMPAAFSFRALFGESEAEDEQDTALGQLLTMLRERWPDGFTAREVTDFLSVPGATAAELLSLLETAIGNRRDPLNVVSIAVGKRLQAISDAPVEHQGKVLRLRYNRHHQANSYVVETIIVNESGDNTT